MDSRELGLRPDPRFPPTRHWEVLIRLVSEHGWERGAEVGVLKGRCLFALLDACPKLSMIGVDAWTYRELSDEPGAEHYRKHDFNRCASEVKARARLYGRRCVILHMDQKDAAAQVVDQSLDFAFLDADHTERGTRAAIEMWLPKIRKGGRLLGHDWLMWPSVRRALDAALPIWEGHEEQVWSYQP